MMPSHPCTGRRGTGDPGVVQALLAAGTELEARNSACPTPWNLAQENEALQGTDAYWRLNEARFNQ